MKRTRLATTLLCALLLSSGASRSAAGAAGAPKPAPPRGQTLGSYQRAAVGGLLGEGPARVDSLRVCVFRVSFADRSFKAQFDSLYYANELRHLAEYFDGASLGAFDLRLELMGGVVALDRSEAYYGDSKLWKERMAEILIKVVLERDDAVDFGRYDAVAVIHAGAGRETDFNDDSRSQIYSGFVNPEEMAEALADTLGTPGVPTNDGAPGDTLFLDNLMVWPEESSQDGYTFGSLGICAYQVGLRLGMVPLFDTTPGDFPDSQGCGNFDLMGYGIYNALGFVPAFPSAFNRYLMGWASPLVVSGDADLRLADVSTAAPHDTGLVKIVVNPSEYFLVENRVHDANFNGRFDFIDLNGNGIPENEDTLRGAEFDFFITATSNLRPKPDSVVTGSGLLIWHVDETAIRRALEAGGYPNDDRLFKGVDLEEADGIQDLDRPGGGFSFGSFYDSYRAGNNDRFAADTDPSSHTNGGAPSGVEISAISAAGRYMTFSVRFSLGIDFTRGEFPAGPLLLSPVVIPLGASEGGGVIMAADSGSLRFAVAGSQGWQGEVLEIANAPGAEWIATPVIADAAPPRGPVVYAVSRGGVLHAYELSGAPHAIDVDGTPHTLQLRGDAASALMLIDGGDPAGYKLLALSSTADSTYLCLIGWEGITPGPGWIARGIEGFETPLARGRLASTPALGVMRKPSDGIDMTGVYFATFGEAALRFHFLPLAEIPDPGATISSAPVAVPEPRGLLALSSGDIDGDGLDEAVAAIPGWGLCYIEYSGAMRRAPVRGSKPSAPILADIDGDGTLETALRDEGHLYLLSGFGVPARGWPIAIDPAVAAAYRTVPAVPPVAGDIDGDDRPEILFRVGGDIHAFDFEGRGRPGWPLPGEGASGGSLALLSGEGGRQYIVDCASVAGAGAGGAVSSIRRYEPGTTVSSELQLWPCFRHDGGGTGRQGASPGGGTADLAVDPSTFIVYPNPAGGSSFAVRVLVSKPARVTVTIMNLEGERVASREGRHDWPAGSAVPFEAAFGTKEMASGVYLCRIEVSGDGWSWRGSKKFAVVK
jgi:M6 family metalloprotease-like protein